MTFLSTKAQTLNAKVGAIALFFGAFFTLLLTHTSLPLAPLRLLGLALVLFSVWAFCDEMGISKPLNRVGFVCFCMAVMSKVQVLLGVSEQFEARYFLLYSAFLLLATFFWSVALLHRQRGLKIVGAVGVLATVLPIMAIIVGHIALGFGAFIGITGLLTAAEGGAGVDTTFVTVVERLFGLWAYVVAWLLWKGHISNSAVA